MPRRTRPAKIRASKVAAGKLGGFRGFLAASRRSTTAAAPIRIASVHAAALFIGDPRA